MQGNTFFFPWEVSLIEWLQAHLGHFGIALNSLFSAFGEEIALIALLAFLYWCYDKEYGKFVGTNLVVSIVWNPLVKNIFLRRRPYFDHTGIKCLKPVDTAADIYNIEAQGYSFPSGHSMQSVSAYTSLAVFRKNRFTLFVGILIPLLVGISRFALGVHYPTDVLTGWLLGGLTIFLVSLLRKKIEKSGLFYLILALTGLPGLFYCSSNDYFSSYGIMLGCFCGFLFEEHFVRFENNRNYLSWILRLVGGFSIFFGMNTLLKLPFSGEFLESGSMAAHLIRLSRYMIVTFLITGPYTKLFRKSKK